MSKPREKQFLIVNSKVDDGKYEVKLFRKNMGGPECDCHLHTTMETIMKYWED